MNNAAFCFYLFSRQNFLLCPMIGKMNNRCTVCLYCFVMVMILALYTKRLQKGAPLHPFENGRSPEFRTYIKFFDKHKKRFTLPPDCDGNDERGWSHGIYVYIFLFFLFFVLSLDSCSLCNSHPLRPLNKTRHTQQSPGKKKEKRKKSRFGLTSYSKKNKTQQSGYKQTILNVKMKLFLWKIVLKK